MYPAKQESIVPTSSFFIGWKERKQHKFSLQRVVGKYFLPRKTFFCINLLWEIGESWEWIDGGFHTNITDSKEKKKALVALSFMFTLHPSINMVVCHRIFAKESSWNFYLMTPEPWKVSGKWDECLLVKELIVEQMIFLWNRLKFWLRENTMVQVSIYMSSFPHYVLLYLCDLDYFQKSLISVIPSLNLESCVDP